MRRRGITLVEVLIAATISAIVMGAAGTAYVEGLRAARGLSQGRDVIARRTVFENTLKNLFAHAYVDADATNTTTYFISGDSISASTPNSTGTSASGGAGDDGSVVFTTLGRRLPSTLLSSTEDFETNNEKFGAVSGVTEVQLGTSPIGRPTGGEEGLFLREQSPSDNDPSQGGTESLLLPDVETISFEFYDGTGWITTWDTNTQGTRRLPSAVRVTYRLQGDAEDRIIVFPIPTSDVTSDDPLAQETAS